MSTKYMFSLLRQEIIAHLRVLYPSTLTEFLSDTRRELLITDFNNGILGVNIGLECDIPAILPAAYYLCSTMKPTQLIDGIKNENTGTLAKLSPEAYRSLAGFQEAWSAKVAEIARDTRPPTGFLDIDTCIADFLDCLSWQDLCCQNPTYLDGRCFFSFRDHLSIMEVCKDCERILASRRTRVQKQMWEALPSFCQLGSWEQLQT